MKKRIHYLVLFLISSVIILFFYGKGLINPNAFLFNDSGDAIKNYYTYYYHIANDSSCVNFNGMNYPYGEHYLYTDCHPLITNLFQFFNSNISQYSIGFINFMMIFSVFLTFFLVYLLLIEFKIQKWFAVIFSIGITLLQPQIFRMAGHFALSYSVCVPLTWLLLIKCFKAKSNLKYVLLLLVNNLFWFFIHAYLGMIIVFFQASFWAVVIIASKEFRKSLKPYLNLLFAVILPLLIFQLFVILTDHHVGRTDNPSGFFLYNAEPDDIFIPNHPPLRPLFDQIPGLHIKLQWEAWSYIGFVFSIIVFYFIIFSVIRLIKKRKDSLYYNFIDNKILNLSLIASFIVLLFAFAFPFKIFPEILDVFPVLKQFRTTGRFDWVFFYTVSVFSVYILCQIYNYYIEKNKKWLSYVIIFVSAGFTIVEGLPYHFETSEYIMKAKNPFCSKYLDDNFKSALSKINESSYQAIIPIPFYYNGSEAYARPMNNSIIRTSMILSAWSKIPITAAYLTRTSVPESKNIMQLMSPSFYPKAIYKDVISDKPFLIVRSNENITEYESDIINKSTLLLKTDSFSLYEISNQKFFENTASIEFNNFDKIKDSLFLKNGFLVNDTSAFIYFNDFENQPSDSAFRGNGAYKGLKKGKNAITQFDPNTFSENTDYLLSAWMYNGEKDALNLWFRLIVEEYNEATDEWFTTVYFPCESETIFGNWSLVEFKFQVKNSKNKIYIVTKGHDDEKAKLHIDDLLIREPDLNIYRLSEQNGKQVLFKNNHEIKL